VAVITLNENVQRIAIHFINIFSNCSNKIFKNKNFKLSVFIMKNKRKEGKNEVKTKNISSCF
jgi:hypothetical protein